LKLRSPEEALEFVNGAGFCFLFPQQGIEMPSLWGAICGSGRPIPVRHHDDRELHLAWRWKDDLPTHGLVYYGKLLRKKPTFVSLDLLPHFYAVSGNYGEPDDYQAEYEDGKLSEEARRVYETLLTRGPLPTSYLRREARLAGKSNAGRFDRALVELQVGLKIVKTGISDANAWKYCYVYDVLLRRWPDLPDRARQITRSEARRTLVLRYVNNAVALEENMIARVFHGLGPRVDEWSETITALVQDHTLRPVRIDGCTEPQLASTEILERLTWHDSSLLPQDA
jgi:hypothetical protein